MHVFVCSKLFTCVLVCLHDDFHTAAYIGSTQLATPTCSNKQHQILHVQLCTKHQFLPFFQPYFQFTTTDALCISRHGLTMATVAPIYIYIYIYIYKYKQAANNVRLNHNSHS